MKYQTKRIVIEAIRFSPFHEHTLKDARDFVGEHFIDDGRSPIPRCFICTPSGDLELNHGDYIVKNGQGEFQKYSSDTFNATYEELSEDHFTNVLDKI